MQNKQQRQKTSSNLSTTITRSPPTPPSTTHNTPAPNSNITSPIRNIPNSDSSQGAKQDRQDQEIVLNDSGSGNMPRNKTNHNKDIAYDGVENKDIECNNKYENSQLKGKRKIAINNDDDEKEKIEEIEEKKNDKPKRKRTRAIR